MIKELTLRTDAYRPPIYTEIPSVFGKYDQVNQAARVTHGKTTSYVRVCTICQERALTKRNLSDQRLEAWYTSTGANLGSYELHSECSQLMSLCFFSPVSQSVTTGRESL